MTHYIIAKFIDTCETAPLVEPIRTLFEETLKIPGIHAVRVKPCCIDRPNRYDLMIEIDMDKDALEAYDVSEPHRKWKQEYGHLLQSKAIFDSEASL